jgi:hypothetical protein
MAPLERWRITCVLAAAWAAMPVHAHHSAKIFDPDTVLALPGTVTRFSWTNPHTYIFVETPGENGELVEWELETDAIPILVRSGWSRDSFTPGERVLVRARPDRNPERRHALLVSIEKADGTVMSARSYFLARPDDPSTLPRATDFSGRWELRFQDYGSFYSDWADLELTEKGAAASSAYDVRLDSPVAQCVAPPLPSILVAPYLNEIEIRGDAIVIRNERFNAERIIYTDGRGHPENGPRTNQGHSIGHWEGDTLVVDTALFADHRAPISGQQGNEGVPSGAQKHAIERIRLSDDRTRLVFDWVVEDPEFLAEPFAGHVEWYYSPQFEMLGFGCDPEIAKRYTLQ